MSAYIHDLAAQRLAEVVRTHAISLDDANAVMDAVVPAVVARAKAEALREAVDLPDPAGHWTHACSPLARQVLLARADEIDGGA